MANYRAVANGNWSSLATWQDNASGSFVASTVLPGVNDDVYTNTFTVTIDQSATVLSLRNTSATGITAGGRFVVTGNFTINATGQGLLSSNAVLLELQTNSPNITTVNSTNVQPTVGNSVATATILISGNGIINFNSSITSGGSTTPNNIQISGNATVNWVGNIIHAGGLQGNVFAITAISATLNFTGSNTNINLYQQGVILFGKSGNTATTSTINIVGNITGPSLFFTTFTAIQSNGVLNITGTLISGVGQTGGGSNLPLISGASANITTINGIIQSNNNRNTVISTSGLLTVSGQINSVNEGWPIIATRLRLANATPTQITFQTDSVGVNKTLYEPGTALGNPATTDVRQGVSYASGALTGTLVVPPANAVTAGVVYDNGTIGTAQNTAASFLTELAASTDPLAVRLKNVATVQTTGDQIAAAL